MLDLTDGQVNVPAQKGGLSPQDSAAGKKAPRDESGWLSGARIVGLLTLLSRLLGLARDVLMAAVFGNSVVMDAFSVAFRVPNLARRLFGEGAFSAAFIPLCVEEEKQRGERSAWQLASTVLIVFTVLLASVVLSGELLLWLAGKWWSTERAEFLLTLLAVLLPYLLLVCLAAQLSAVLHTRNRFAVPAFLPVVLNVVWIAVLAGAVPSISGRQNQMLVVCGGVLIGGVLQMATPLPLLFRLGFRFRWSWRTHRQTVSRLISALLPVMLVLSVTQINTLADSLLAWFLARPKGGGETVPWLFDVPWPLTAGTAAALYFAQRLYQFPLGVFGVAVGTAIFPALARQARGAQRTELCNTVAAGLRLVIVIGVPAGVGLMLLAEPVTRLLFQYGAFDSEDVVRTASLIAAYSSAVWAACGLMIVQRAFFAVGNRRTPLQVGLLCVLLNLGLDGLLLWPWGGTGLAWATALTTMIQWAALYGLLAREIGPLPGRQLLVTAGRTAVAVGGMAAVCYGLLLLLPASSSSGWGERLGSVLLPIAGSVAVYFALCRLLGLDEARWLFRHHGPPSENV